MTNRLKNKVKKNLPGELQGDGLYSQIVKSACYKRAHNSYRVVYFKVKTAFCVSIAHSQIILIM